MYKALFNAFIIFMVAYIAEKNIFGLNNMSIAVVKMEYTVFPDLVVCRERNWDIIGMSRIGERRLKPPS